MKERMRYDEPCRTVCTAVFSGEEPAHALGTEDHDRKSTDLVQR